MTDTEKRIAQKWTDLGVSKTNIDSDKPKYYCLDMFPYPSGEGLHVGHWRGYVLSDVHARQKKMSGYEVLHPMGFDAFGLPAENYAIQTGVHPAESTIECMKRYRPQLDDIGTVFDWDYTLNTCDPDYYKWTQWLFLQLYKNDLAYKKESAVNWCPSCATVLANEQVVDSCCDRCDTPVEKKDMNQWFFKITEFADALVDDVENLDWPEKVKTMQKNWISRSYGTDIEFEIDTQNLCHPELVSGSNIKVFTTRVDTIFGCTYVVLAPEHELVDKIITAEQKEAVEAYKEATKNKSDLDRQVEKDKTGVFTGAYAINPFTGKEVPVWIGDYVLASYGTGAVMAVPAHDERDYEFAKKYELEVVQSVSAKKDFSTTVEMTECAYCEKGILIDSGEFTGMKSDEAITAMQAWLEETGNGAKKKQYKLRDWLISRQRYWGCPIPVVYCDDCGIVPVPEDQLPVEHPRDVEFSSEGGNPLAQSEDFVHCSCPKCGSAAKR
ncbi:MAG: leucine--tRNA ligase, partial [Patescibacteria group bacterium]|nr:leucine--tRNA ligase [Patescibacteria group bacterium]